MKEGGGGSLENPLVRRLAENLRKRGSRTMYAERLLPHDIEAEEALIGALLIDGDAMTRIAPELKAGDFFRERNRLCYQGCADLYARGEAIDQVTLARELARTNRMDDAGGMAYLSHLVSITPTSAHVEHYAGIVKRLATMRKLIDASARISALGYADTDDVEATLQAAVRCLEDVLADRPIESVRSLRAVFDRYLRDQADVTDPGDSSAPPILSGFPDLDELAGGLSPGDLVLLAARPSVGKTALAMNMAVNAASQERGSWCSAWKWTKWSWPAVSCPPRPAWTATGCGSASTPNPRSSGSSRG